MRRRSRWMACVILEICALGAGQQASAARLAPLGRLGENPLSGATDVSADGSVVVGFSGRPVVWVAIADAFRWTSDGGLIGLGNPPLYAFPRSYSVGLYSSVAVSADGAVIVGWSDFGDDIEAYRWNIADGTLRLGDLSGGLIRSYAEGVSADGSVVVGSSSTDVGTEAFRWTSADGMVGLGRLPGSHASEAFDVSADGSVIVGSSSSVDRQDAFRWTTADGMIGLGDLPGASSSAATAISSDGSVIVGWSRSEEGREAFRWTSADGIVGLGHLEGGSPNCHATDVSADGAVIVGMSQTTRGEEAFVWDAIHGMRLLTDVLAAQGVDLTGWRLSSANAVSADGTTIVGHGINPAGQWEAWLAEIRVVPEPSAASLVLAGAIAVSRSVRPQRRHFHGHAGRTDERELTCVAACCRPRN